MLLSVSLINHIKDLKTYFMEQMNLMLSLINEGSEEFGSFSR